MNVENDDMAEATVAYTTIVNGEELTEEKTYTGTKAEVEAQLKEFESAEVKTTGAMTEISVEKEESRK